MAPAPTLLRQPAASRSPKLSGLTIRPILPSIFLRPSWHREDVATTQLRESGVVTGTGETDQFRILGGATYDLSRTDSITWTAQARRVTFTNTTSETPYNDYAASVAWNRLLDPTTTLTTSVSFDWYDADDLFKSQRLFWQIMTGVRSQLTRRLTVTAIGGRIICQYLARCCSPPFGTTTFQTGARSGGVGSVGLNYRLTKTTSVYASAAHLIVPTTTGQLQKTTTAGFGINHNINDWSSVAFGAHYAHTNTGSGSSIFVGTEGDFFSAYVAYSYQISSRLAHEDFLCVQAARRQYGDRECEYGIVVIEL